MIGAKHTSVGSKSTGTVVHKQVSLTTPLLTLYKALLFYRRSLHSQGCSETGAARNYREIDDHPIHWNYTYKDVQVKLFKTTEEKLPCNRCRLAADRFQWQITVSWSDETWGLLGFILDLLP
jgi:hypothetical protein